MLAWKNRRGRPPLLGAFARTVAVTALLGVSPLAAQEDAEEPPAEIVEPEDSAAEIGPTTRIVRSFSLARVGAGSGVTLKGPADERELFFPLPRNAEIEEAWLDIDLDHSTPVSDLASLQLSVNGVPRVAEMLDRGNRLRLPLELDPQALDRGVVGLSMAFAAPHTEDLCFDERAVPDFAVLRPSSGLHLAVEANSVESLRTAWMLLPQTVTISIGHQALTAETFGALLEISRRLVASGRHVRYARLPDIPDNAPVGVLASGLGGARSLLFNGSSEDTSFGIGHIIVAAEEELAELEEDIAAAQERFLRFTGASEGEIPQPTTEFTPDEGEPRPMRLVRFLDYPVIAVGGTDPESTAALLSGEWDALADVPTLDAAFAAPHRLQEQPRDGTAFSQLNFDGGVRTAAARAEWALNFGLRDLPEGRLPSAVEIHMVAGRSNGDAPPPLVNVYLNDVLIASLETTQDGQRHAQTVALPAYLVDVENNLRMELQRRTDSANCMVPSGGSPAEVLASSRLLTEREAARPRDFLELISHLGPRPLFILPEDLLGQADEVMPLLARLSAAILPENVRPELRFLGESSRLTAGRPFVLVGNPGEGRPQAPFTAEEGRGLLRSGSGQVLLESSMPERAAIVQLARLGDDFGFWVVPGSEGRYPSPPDFSLDRSSVALISNAGMALALQNDPDATARTLYPWREGWKAQVARHAYTLLAGLGLLLLLVIGVVILRRRRRLR